MKTILKASIIFCGLLVSFCAFGDSIPTEGTWTDKGIRALILSPPSSSIEENTLSVLIPSPPSASIEENTLSVFIAKPLTNLTIQVTDLDGNVVYEECITTYENNFTYKIQLNAPAGEYHLRLVHYYGTLAGNFNIK
jgi:hypothetical protein